MFWFDVVATLLVSDCKQSVKHINKCSFTMGKCRGKIHTKMLGKIYMNIHMIFALILAE